MSWGLELWDQYDNLGSHTLRGIEFLEKYGQFIKDRCSIESEYASKLRKLVKNYQPKKKEDEDYQFSACKAFILMMNEINDMAGQHEVIGENLMAQVVKEIAVLVKELKDDRKRHLQEGAKLQANLQASLSQLDKAKKSYEKAFKESEKAQENYQKADADLNLSRAEVEKARIISTMKTQGCEDSKTDYANQLQKTNEVQRQHYSELMPKVFQQLQEMDERRILSIQNFINHTSEVQHKVIPILNKCLDGIARAADSIDAKHDSQLVIERYKSGFTPPEDIPFEDLSTHKNGDTSGQTPPVVAVKTETIKGTFSAGKIKKRGGLFGIFGANKHNDESKEDYSDLPPNQRKKKLQQKIDNISCQIQQETATRDGLMKMKGAYEQNPALGDPLSVEGQLAENGHKLEKLQAELQKFQTYLAEAEGKPVTPNSRIRSRNSVSEDSLSRSASESSVNNPNNNNKLSAPGTPIPPHGSESGIGASHNSIPDADAEFEEGDHGEFEMDPLPVLGTARAIYAFDAQSEGSIPMFEGEEFEVVELDQGDGWTRVRRSNLEEGFVPTSYIDCFLYNNC